jgi:murein DD-endopeptidase MepM/ murein hydrolase activator NlpD
VPRSVGSALLEHADTSRERTEPTRVPGRFGRAGSAPDDAAAASGGPETTTTAAVAETDDAADTAIRRRLPRPPGRRGPLWLAALVAGALAAATPGLLGEPDSTPVSVSAADYGLGADAMGGTGDMEDLGVRQGISEAEAQARLDELAASRAARTPTTAAPVQGARMTTCFCMRWGSMHWGVDLAAPLGTPIYAATDGVVLRAGRASGYGNAIYVQDADGDVHVYGHMRYYDVEAGQIVHAGDEIAQVGSEGQSTGPHLHYEIHRGGMDGRRIDPEEYLAERGVEV